MKSEKISKMLQIAAPGTELYEGLENVLRARTGALIVVGDSAEVLSLVKGGFKLDCDFTPFAVYELAKMDGAIILSSNADKILYANAHLMPDTSISSTETGLRHSTAERVAKCTDALVIAISHRRNIITLYSGHTKYVMSDISVVLAKANQALQTLGNYRSSFSKSLTDLTILEFEDEVTLNDVVNTVQRYELMRRVADEVSSYITELGVEGRLVSMQLDELMTGTDQEMEFVLMDYLNDYKPGDEKKIMESISVLNFEDVLDLSIMGKVIFQSSPNSSLTSDTFPRGFRALSRISRLPMPIIWNIIDSFGSLQAIMDASVEELDDVEGIGEVRARVVKDGLERLSEQAFAAKF